MLPRQKSNNIALKKKRQSNNFLSSKPLSYAIFSSFRPSEGMISMHRGKSHVSYLTLQSALQSTNSCIALINFSQNALGDNLIKKK